MNRVFIKLLDADIYQNKQTIDDAVETYLYSNSVFTR